MGVKKLCIEARRSLPPPPDPVSAADPPQSTGKNCPKIDLNIQARLKYLKSQPKVPPGSRRWLKMALQESFWTLTGWPEAPKTYKNTGKSMFLRCPQNRPRRPSGRSLSPPAPPNRPPSCPKGAQRAKKVSICGSFFVFFSRSFFSLGCQMGSGTVPERPPAPKNYQK